jgi:hypothetical protein
VQLDTRLALANGMVAIPASGVGARVQPRPLDRPARLSQLFAVDGARAWSEALKVNAGSRIALN